MNKHIATTLKWTGFAVIAGAVLYAALLGQANRRLR